MAIEITLPPGRNSWQPRKANFLERGETVTLQNLAPGKTPLLYALMLNGTDAGFFREINPALDNAKSFWETLVLQPVPFIVLLAGTYSPLVKPERKQFYRADNHPIIMTPMMNNGAANPQGPFVLAHQFGSPIIDIKNLDKDAGNVWVRETARGSDSALIKREDLPHEVDAGGYPVIRFGYPYDQSNQDNVDALLTNYVATAFEINAKNEAQIYDRGSAIIKPAISNAVAQIRAEQKTEGLTGPNGEIYAHRVRSAANNLVQAVLEQEVDRGKSTDILTNSRFPRLEQ